MNVEKTLKKINKKEFMEYAGINRNRMYNISNHHARMTEEEQNLLIKYIREEILGKM